jgi:hypothetical protein
MGDRYMFCCSASRKSCVTLKHLGLHVKPQKLVADESLEQPSSCCQIDHDQSSQDDRNDTNVDTEKIYSRSELLAVNNDPSCLCWPQKLCKKYLNERGLWDPHCWSDSLHLRQVVVDCDSDALVIEVQQQCVIHYKCATYY